MTTPNRDPESTWGATPGEKAAWHSAYDSTIPVSTTPSSPNNTEEWWSITGSNGQEVSLHQYGWSVTTVGGSRYDLPPRRGENLAIAYRPGQLHRRKLPDARPITLLMYMVGFPSGVDSGVSQFPNTDQRTQWNDNWDFLRRLVYEHSFTDNLVVLRRRWRLTAPEFPTTRDLTVPLPTCIQGDPGVPASGVSRIVTAAASAEMTGTMAPTMTGRLRADFQMDFTLPDPFFYGATTTFTMNPGQTRYVWNDGHDVASYSGMTVKFVGPLHSPTLVNAQVSPSNVLKFNGNIGADFAVTLYVGQFRAFVHPKNQTPPVQTSAGNRIQYVTSTGARTWFNLVPGSNHLGFSTADSSDAANGGHVEVSFRPPYV